MINSDRNPLKSFVNGILGFPSTVYNRGGEHGKEWSRMYRGDEVSNDQQQSASCPYRRHNLPAIAQAGDGNGDDKDDWMYRVAKDMEKNEEQARILYSSWKQEEEIERKSLEENAKKQQEQAGRGSDWRGSQCHRSNRNDDERRQSNIERQGQLDSCSSHAAPPTALSADLDGIRNNLENKWREWDKDMDQLVRDADPWRKQWFKDDSLWPSADIFGADIPFSKPLSSLVAIGMAPAFLRFEPASHPIGYLLYSPYSPLALEHCEGFDKNWRNRFEDLLRAEEGKELMTQDEMARANHASGMAWMIRQVLPLLSKDQEYPKLASIEQEDGNHQSRTTASDGYAEPATEQAMYEAYHNLFGNLTRESVDHPVDLKIFQAKGQLQKPDILSTLTTTERHMSPDGSVTTKTVLKRRFTDGREETEENIETSKGAAMLQSAQQQRRPLPLPGSSKSQETQQSAPAPASAPTPAQQQPAKRGWFWSN